MKLELKITIDENGEIEVWQGDKTTRGLCFGEMIEQVTRLALKHTDGLEDGYPMRTQQEWDELRNKRMAIIASFKNTEVSA